VQKTQLELTFRTTNITAKITNLNVTTKIKPYVTILSLSRPACHIISCNYVTSVSLREIVPLPNRHHLPASSNLVTLKQQNVAMSKYP